MSDKKNDRRAGLSDRERAILDLFPVPLLLTDGTGQAVYANHEALELAGMSDGDDLNSVFSELGRHIFTTQENGPEAISRGTSPAQQTLHFHSRTHGRRRIQVLSRPWPGVGFMHMLRDVTREIGLIEEYAFLKKEKAARRVLQKKKDEELKHYRELVRQMLDNFPDVVCIINRDRQLIINNIERQTVFSAQNPSFCYDVFHRNRPCAECPLDRETGHGKNQVVGHHTGDRYLTETVIPFKDREGALLLFRETTRQVILIEKIRDQRDTIQKQKDLFAEIADTMTLMQNETDVQKVADSVLALLCRRFHASAGALLTEGVRRGQLWSSSSCGLSKNNLKLIEKNYLSLPLRNKGTMNLDAKSLPEGNSQWQQLPLTTSDDYQQGILLLNADIDQEGHNVLLLFMEPFRAYLKNRSLTSLLEIKANTDELTGLYNRRYFEEALSQEIDKAHEFEIPFSVLAIDANGLKPVNDLYGHQAGDALIQAVGKALTTVARSTDTAARMGGDEFAILLPNTGTEGARILTGRLREYCEKHPVPVQDETEVPLSLSIGFAGSDTVPFWEVMKSADDAMYRDKKEFYKTHKKYR